MLGKYPRNLSFLNYVKGRAALSYNRACRLFMLFKLDSSLGIRNRLLMLKAILEPGAFHSTEIVIGGSATTYREELLWSRTAVGSLLSEKSQIDWKTG